jgi:ABC-type lipoprotein export system ATPase subunit
MSDAGTASEPLVRGDGVTRTFGSGRTATVALRPATFTVPPGARIALVGRSGSGKSTLVHLMAGLDAPTGGRISWPAIGARGDLRPARIGVIFQGPSLLAPLTVLENAALPLVLGGAGHHQAQEAARTALGHAGIDELADKLPEEISGGQAQRVAVARALAGRPHLILADEPTGQLDRAAAATVVELLLSAAAHAGAGLVVSTHDAQVAERLPHVWQMHSGRLTGHDRVGAS